MIDIVMATYNGEKHIKTQVLSLMSQTFQNWHLHIYDDCSTDNSVEIIRELCAIDDRISLHLNKKNIGCALTFLNGIRNTESEFVVLCDQDDIWVDSKLEALLSSISHQDISIPRLCFSRGYQYDDKSKIITGRINMNVPVNLADFLLLNGGIQGCSMIFNHSLVQLIKQYDSLVAMHDHYISALAFMFGEIELLDCDLMLYRKHSNNVTNSVHGSTLFKYLSFYKNNNYLIDEVHFLAIKSLYAATKQDLSADKKKLLNEYLSLPYKNKLGLLKSILKNKFTVKNSVILALIMAIIFDKYGLNNNSKLVSWETDQ